MSLTKRRLLSRLPLACELLGFGYLRSREVAPNGSLESARASLARARGGSDSG
jgi:hypothetical protein